MIWPILGILSAIVAGTAALVVVVLVGGLAISAMLEAKREDYERSDERSESNRE